ncbi:MAG: hypothetical protein CM15mP23_03990 [Cryomorphaceae bacterium]|jgi:hypothetical protein|nr:MAG: hypothetical protein CM15mP23_03990 [Cryomorphaceae bacterium]|tara:strand:+ start:638 stop:865 length:228 start_codon:yes stop_codon:yes gene_type:complete
MAADELIHIYSGSFLNAQFVANVLDENNIKCMVKDDYQNSIIAGWVSPGSENSVRVFVANKDVEAAKEVIKNARD